MITVKITSGGKSTVQGTGKWSYAWINNAGETAIYATTEWGTQTVTERIAEYEAGGAKDIVKLPAGSSKRLRANNRPVIIFGAEAGMAEVDLTNTDVSPFKVEGKGGGSGGDGSTKYIGTTTTALSNGSTTNPITVDGESYTAQFGDIAVYNYTEFIFDGTKWGEFGRSFDLTPKSGSANAVTSGGIYDLIHKGSGVSAIAIGATSSTGTTASGVYSTAMGCATTASGAASTAIGDHTIANQDRMTAMGKYNSPSAGDLFNIGNGTGANARSNIVEVNSTSMNVNGDIKKNGVSLGDLAYKDSASGTAVTNVVYDSANERFIITVGTVTVS